MASILSSELAPPSMDHAAARLCSTVWAGAARVLKVGETVGVGVTVGVKVGRGVAVDLGVDTAVRGKVGGAVGVGVRGDRVSGAVGVSTAGGRPRAAQPAPASRQSSSSRPRQARVTTVGKGETDIRGRLCGQVRRQG